MPLPSSIEKMFDSTYNDFKAARLHSSMECNNLQLMLKDAGVSFDTKIIKHKKRGRQFIVMLVDTHGV